MRDLPRRPVKELCSVIVDCVNRTAPTVDGPTPYRMIRTTNVRDGRIDLSECRYVDRETYETWTRRAKVLDGDVILTREAPIGEVGYVSELGDVFLGQRIVQFRPDPRRVVPRYLYYTFRSPDLRHQFGMHEGSGSVVSHIRVADCLEFKVSTPPLAEQQAVADLLGAIDDKIELNRRMNETLEAMAQAIFRDWFVDFGPVHRKLAGATDPVEIMGGVTTDSARASELVRLFPDGLDHDGLPIGWQQGAARDLIEFNPREALRGGALAPYSDMASLPTRGTVADLPVMRPFGSGMRFRNGDALLARITPCLENGKGAWVDFLPHDAPVGWGSTEFIVLRGRAGTPVPFGYLLTRDPNFRRHAIQSMTGTSGRQRAQAESLETWPIALPAPSVLAAFGGHVNPLFARITAAAEESRTLAEMRDYLLPRLMSGEVRVGGMTQEIAA